MNRHDRDELENDIRKALDELKFVIANSVYTYHDLGTTIADIDLSDNLNEKGNDNLPDDWDKKVEAAISDVAFDWGGFISWNDWTLSISIPDND